jgi:hypothetical protein
MHQQLWEYKVEEKLHVGVREQKRLNTADLKGSIDGVITHRSFGLQFPYIKPMLLNDAFATADVMSNEKKITVMRYGSGRQ